MRFGQVHIFPLQVDFDLLDAGGVVHHPSYLVLCERARVAAMEDAGFPFGKLWEQGYSFALVDTKSKYFKAALLGQHFVMITRCLGATGASMTLEQEMLTLKPGALLLRGYQTTLNAEMVADKFFWIEMRVASIRLNPIKAVRLPQSVIDAFHLPAPKISKTNA